MSILMSILFSIPMSKSIEHFFEFSIESLHTSIVSIIFHSNPTKEPKEQERHRQRPRHN